MGSFSIWHWLIVLAILAFPAIIIALEKSEASANRSKYACSLITAIVLSVLADYVQPFVTDFEGAGMAVGLTSLAVWIYFLRVLVQRVRDAGHRKALAYLAVVPVLNLFFFIYLLFPSSTTRSAVQGS